MAEAKKKIDWRLVAAVAFLAGATAWTVGLTGSRLTKDSRLIREVRLNLLNDCMPDSAGELKVLLASNALESEFKRAAAAAGIDLDIRELKAAHPILFETRSSRRGVLKIRFTLKAGGAIVERGARYYHYEYRKWESVWNIEGPAERFQYYLSFLYHD